MTETEYRFNGYTIRGIRYLRHNTIPPHWEGTTHGSALETALSYPPRQLKCGPWQWCPTSKAGD